MKKLFKKPQYKIYGLLSLIAICSILYSLFTPNVKAKDVGIARKGENIKCEGFSFSAQITPNLLGNMQGLIEVYFDDTAKIPGDILLSAQYHDLALDKIDVTYSYTRDGKEYTAAASNSLLTLDLSKALGGISFRQPFPNGSQRRRLTFRQKVEGNVSNLSAEGYIAVGEQLHNCKVTDGVLDTINSQKAYRFGSVQLIRFTFSVQE